MDNNKRKIGTLGEASAAEYLIDKNYEILCMNYYGKKRGEIDIVAYDKSSDCVVFVEVKTRKNKMYGTAAESIDEEKIKNIIKTAKNYMMEYPSDSDIRFDVIEVYYKSCDTEKLVVDEINHIKNAILDVSEYK